MCNKYATILQSISCEDDSPLQKLQIGALAFFGLQLRDAVSRFSRITIAKVTSFPGFSRTRPYEEREREREREAERQRGRETHTPWLGLVTWLQNKINSEGGVLCLTILCLVHAMIARVRKSKIDLLTLQL